MAKDILYIGTNGHVAAIQPATGEEIWRTRLGEGLFNATGHQDVCVLEHDAHVFAGSHGHLFCLDAASGEILWHNELKGLGHNDITLSIAGKSIQFVATHSRSHSSS
jgi:outer membrane protein assembly factor BamB